MRAALALLALLGVRAMPAAAHQEAPPTAAEPAQASAPPAAAPASSRWSYILYRTQRRMGLMFRRELSSAEVEARLEGARGSARDLHREAVTAWERIDASCRAGSTAPRCGRPRPRPEPPTDDGARALIDLSRDIMIIDRNRIAARSAEGPAQSFVYLIPVRPGTYVLYGQRDPDRTLYQGVCLCMGSLRFDAPDGQVVDLGTITFPGLEAAGARPSEQQAMTTAMENSIALVPSRPGADVPAIVGNRPVAPAQLRAAGKQDNLYGLYIDRHPAMPGVLRYERDRVIDDRTGNPIDAPGQ
jgi:hypothetical protein